MNKLILFRVQFNTSPMIINRLNPDWIETQLNLFMNYTYKTLLNQSSSDFFYILEVDASTLPLIHAKYDSNPLLPSVIFTAHPSSTIETLFQNYDVLYTVNINTETLLSKDFVEKLYLYTPLPTSRNLILQTSYSYNISDQHLYQLTPPLTSNYIFICPKLEYTTYFKIYDLFYPHALNMHFHKMPYETLTSLTSIRLNYTGPTSSSTLIDPIQSESILNCFF